MADEKNRPKTPHHVILEDRNFLTVSGVSDIDSFNEETAVLFTELGELTIRGSDLHMNKLNVDTGEVTIEGDIHTLVYTDDRPKKLFAAVPVVPTRRDRRESFDCCQHADAYFSAVAFDGSGVGSGVRPVSHFPNRCPASGWRHRRRGCNLFCLLWLYVFLFNDDSKFRTGAFFYFVGGTDWLFAVLFNHRCLGDERCPADHFWHPVLFSAGLEMDAAPGGSPVWMGRQENQKNSQKTGKKYEKSCAKTQKTLANKADNIV